METLNNLAWYWQSAILVVWFAACLTLFLAGISAKRHGWIAAVLSGVLFFGALGWLIGWSWLDDNAPRGRCEAAGGIVVVTPAQGRACIDKSAVIPYDAWH